MERSRARTALRGLLTPRTVLYGLAVFVLGSLIGVGFFTFIYAKGASYLTSDPAACANCHTMDEHYQAWTASSHGKVAGCNDCHSPHDNIVQKYANKGVNGFFHGLAMTTGDHPDNIRIKNYNLKITEEACLYCHADITSEMRSVRAHSQKQSCVSCHRTVGHL